MDASVRLVSIRRIAEPSMEIRQSGWLAHRKYDLQMHQLRSSLSSRDHVWVPRVHGDFYTRLPSEDSTLRFWNNSTGWWRSVVRHQGNFQRSAIDRHCSLLVEYSIRWILRSVFRMAERWKLCLKFGNFQIVWTLSAKAYNSKSYRWLTHKEETQKTSV